MNILGLDPGGTTGYGLISCKDNRATLYTAGSTRDQNLGEIQDLFEMADIVVCEDWKTRPKKAGSGAFDWNPMNTTRVIGAAETRSSILGKKFVLQQASIKPVGYGFANQKYTPGKKGMHTQDAIAHAMYYAVRNQLCIALGKRG